jgi:hypothetical protein
MFRRSEHGLIGFFSEAISFLYALCDLRHLIVFFFVHRSSVLNTEMDVTGALLFLLLLLHYYYYFYYCYCYYIIIFI